MNEKENILKSINSKIGVIESKKFSIEASGYNMFEVDGFLDQISNYLENLKQIYALQENRIYNLKEKVINIEKQYNIIFQQRNYENKLLNDVLSKTAGNLSIIERLNKIENKLQFNKKK